MVTMVLYIPSDATRFPVAFRRFLLCKTTRAMIMSVRRMLSEREIKKYGIKRLTWMEGTSPKVRTVHKVPNTA